MKRTLLLSAILGMASLAHAQLNGHYLVAENSYTHNGTSFLLNDTTSYKYGNTHGRLFMPELDEWSYDTASHYSVIGGLPSLRGRSVNQYSGQQWPAVQAYESLQGSTFTPEENTARTYTTTGQILTEVYARRQWGGSGVENVYRLTNTYTANGQIGSVVNEQWNSMLGQFENSYRTAYTYDANNLLQTEEQESYTGTMWEPAARTDYTYVNGKMTEMLYRTHNGSNYVNAYMTEYTYDANGRITNTESKTWNGMSWNNTTAQALAYDGQGNIVTEEYFSWNGSSYEPSSRNEMTYLRGSVASMVNKSWNGTAYELQMGNDSTHYFYDFAISVPQAPATAKGISVYPNPAGSFINLKLDLAAQQRYTAVLMDATGKTVRLYNNEATGNTIHRLNVQDLPVGNYMLKVNAGGYVNTEKIVIAR